MCIRDRAKEILLSGGMATTVDDADHDWLVRWKWSYLNTRGGGYARRTVRLVDGRQRTILMHRVILNAPAAGWKSSTWDLNPTRPD